MRFGSMVMSCTFPELSFERELRSVTSTDSNLRNSKLRSVGQTSAAEAWAQLKAVTETSAAAPSRRLKAKLGRGSFARKRVSAKLGRDLGQLPLPPARRMSNSRTLHFPETFGEGMRLPNDTSAGITSVGGSECGERDLALPSGMPS